MKVKELIAELQKYPNQDAEINLVSNLIDIDNEAFDSENCDIDFFQQDVDNVDNYDVYIFKKNVSTEPTIHDLLDDNDKLTIKLDTKDKYANIVILDEKERVLREIQVDGHHSQPENIAIMLSNII